MLLLLLEDLLQVALSFPHHEHQVPHVFSFNFRLDLVGGFLFLKLTVLFENFFRDFVNERLKVINLGLLVGELAVWLMNRVRQVLQFLLLQSTLSLFLSENWLVQVLLNATLYFLQLVDLLFLHPLSLAEYLINAISLVLDLFHRHIAIFEPLWNHSLQQLLVVSDLALAFFNVLMLVWSALFFEELQSCDFFGVAEVKGCEDLTLFLLALV